MKKKKNIELDSQQLYEVTFTKKLFSFEKNLKMCQYYVMTCT